MNRSAKQLPLFECASDYRRFLDVLIEAEDRLDMRLIDYCAMPNHWHLLLWPEDDDDLARYLRWVTGVHGQRWRRDHESQGKGAVYQGRYRWVAVQDDLHLAAARRYIVQNPVRAGLVASVHLWPWSSIGRSPTERGPRLTDIDCPGLGNLDDALDEDVFRRISGGLSAKKTFGSPEWRRALDVEMWLADALERRPPTNHLKDR
jgi:REP element-mobilizing transposase RayT